MNKLKYPILYSFRRCPYAIRTRMVIKSAKIIVELREIKLNDKPKDFLEISPKGTVPVLITNSGQVLEESLDIIYWALRINDPNNLLSEYNLSKKKLMSF
jgi:glutathione S-transferase